MLQETVEGGPRRQRPNSTFRSRNGNVRGKGQKPTLVIKVFSNGDKENTFARAFRKALISMSRRLQRRLNRKEWERLRSAVRKQIRGVKQDENSRVLREILNRISVLETTNPSNAQALSNSIGVFQVQVSALREQALRLMEERNHPSPTCPHYWRKKLVSPPAKLIGKRLNIQIPGIGWISTEFDSGPYSTCCQDCRMAREDAFFYWTGLQIPEFSEWLDATPEVAALTRNASLSPRNLDSFWKQVIQLRFQE